MSAFPYVVAVGPSTAATPSQVLTVFESWTLDRNFDDGCTFSFACPGNSLPGILIEELSTDVWLYRSGVLEQRFRVVEVEQAWDADGKNSLAVIAVCYRRLLASRHVVSPLTFTGVSQGDIVWQLIQHTQAQTGGNLGVTLVSAGPSILRDRDYAVGQNILEAIVDLSKAENGIAWEIDANLGLTVTQPQSFPSKPQPVQLGTNARGMAKPSGASLFANAVIATGDAQFTTPVVAESLGLGSDPRGRWERYGAFTGAQQQTTVQEQADGLLDDTVSPAIVYRFELEPDRFFSDSNYLPGDFVTIVEPGSVVPSTVNPTVAQLTVPGQRVAAQVLTQAVQVTDDGKVTISCTAVRSFQRWDDVPARITWDSLDPALSWDNLNNTYLD